MLCIIYFIYHKLFYNSNVSASLINKEYNYNDINNIMEHEAKRILGQYEKNPSFFQDSD